MKKLVFNTVRNYTGTLLNHVVFRSMEVDGYENLPDSTTPTLLVGNHRNGLCDPLSVVCNVTDRKVHVFTRGSVFQQNDKVSRMAEGLGMVPTYRQNMEGLDMVGHNYEAFAYAGHLLMQGSTLLIYPEGYDHEDCHLGDFSSAYLRMAFEAARQADFKRDVKIVPTGVHYDSIRGLRNRALLRFGSPISLAPYYEQYQQKPRTTCRELNKRVREAVRALVLEIPQEDYDQREFLCLSRKTSPLYYGQSLLQLLQRDQQLMAELELMPDITQQRILNETRQYMETLERCGTTAETSGDQQQPTNCMLHWLLLLLQLPLYVVCLWPSIVPWKVSEHLASWSGKVSFKNAYLLGLGGLVLMPLLMVGTMVLIGVSVSWPMGLVWFAIQPLAVLYAWDYRQELVELEHRMHYDLLSEEEAEVVRQMGSRLMGVCLEQRLPVEELDVLMEESRMPTLWKRMGF